MGESSTIGNLSLPDRGASGVSKSAPRPGEEGMSPKVNRPVGAPRRSDRGWTAAKRGGAGAGAPFLAMMGDDGSKPGPGVS